MTFEKHCEAELTAALEPRLSPHGFRRSGTLYSLATADATAMVWLQKSRESEKDKYKVAINLGAYSALALSAEWQGRIPKKPTFADAQVRWRLGEDQSGDRWWLIQTETELKLCRNEILGLLSADQIEMLLHLSTAKGMLEYFDRGEYGGQSEVGRERIMNALRQKLS